MNSAGVAEGRGGYPGRRGKSGWTEYVAEQQCNIAVFRALVSAFGDAPGDGMRMLRSFEQSFPRPVRCMGDGYEPHVDDVAGRLIYSLPVDSSFVGVSFSYEVQEPDLAALLADPYRRAVLEVVAHTVLQRSMIRGNAEVTPTDFRHLVDRTLHSTMADLTALIIEIDRDHNTSVDHLARDAMARRATAPSDGEPPCVS